MKQLFLRYRKNGGILGMCILFFLSACATDPIQEEKNDTPVAQKKVSLPSPQDKKLKNIIDMQTRLEKVAGIMLLNNADLCRNQLRHLLGFNAANKYSYSSRLSASAEKMLGLGEKLQVTYVIPGSGAEQAGLLQGDKLLAIENQPLPEGPSAENDTVRLLAPIVASKTSVNLVIERNNAVQMLNIPLTKACGFRVELGHTDRVNAFADGQRILITRGMMKFTQNDHELSYVIGKEIAHNVLKHPDTLGTVDINRKTIDNLIQITPDQAIPEKHAKPMTRQFDLDSDTLGLAMSLRAGFEIDSAVNFWKRLSYAYPATDLHSYNAGHPSSGARLALMPQTITRIKLAEEKKKALIRRNGN